jgi:anti-sigma regulatory factor (Ser/Thr protein kinase)
MAQIGYAVFPPVPESVSRARRFVATHLEDCRTTSVESATLVVSELATNAIRHAETQFSVAVVHDDETATIEVAHHGAGEPAARAPDLSVGQRFRIVDAVVDDWGLRESPEGTVVFARLPC